MVSLNGPFSSRGFIIEKAQPFLKEDVDLVKRVLENHDEIVIGIGSAGKSHELGGVMTAGERLELVDHVLKCEGIAPEKYILLPIEDTAETSSWVSEIMMLTPRWDTFYTRNFRNASMFGAFQPQYGYSIKTIPEQKQEGDYYHAIANSCRGVRLKRELFARIPESAQEKMQMMGITDRCDVMYNRQDYAPNSPEPGLSRAFFLGGLQPLTGIYSEGTGHLGVIKKGIEEAGSIVIAVGSAQCSHSDSDPLTAGKRIDIIRSALLDNSVSASQFSIIPIKDIAANASYAAKVVSLCPKFDSVLAGNDWTKQLFGEGHYRIIPIPRSSYSGGDKPLSASLVRKIVCDTIRECNTKETAVSGETILAIEQKLSGMIDKSVMASLRRNSFYDTMHFLAFAKE